MSYNVFLCFYIYKTCDLYFLEMIEGEFKNKFSLYSFYILRMQVSLNVL